MRIDALNQVSQLYKSGSGKKIASLGNAGGSDYVEISRIGHEYQSAKKAIAAAPDIREDRVETIKEAISSGTYEVSDEKLADKLLDDYFKSFLG